ncbi:peptidoglycan DD-metalloendopeptidase family protein [Thermoanaerobacter mathranii]|uniref:peptidoglycan DD-metalloendopeptidase family protein n=1 Tax=Thermoanaerobacter mathranii TaxID=583357 RepID=UPI003D6A6F32
MSLKNWTRRKIKGELRKRTFKAGVTLLKNFLKHILVMGAPVIIAGVFVILFIAAVYVQFTEGQAAAGISSIDVKYQQAAKKYTTYANTINVYVEGRHLPQNEAYKVVYEIGDQFHFTKNEILTEGDLATGVLFFSYSTNTEIDDPSSGKVKEEYFKDIAEKLSPTLHYKWQRLRIFYDTVEKDDKGKPYIVTKETETYTYLLVRANNIVGDKVFKYNIVWKEYTTTDEETGLKLTVKYETPEFKGTELLSPIYERLDKFIVERLQIKREDVTDTRRMFLEASRGYNEMQERLAWLTEDSAYGSGFFVSTADIPPYLWDIINELSSKYNIPWWFTAAVIMKESSFRIDAENPKTGAWGLMQVMPRNWQTYTRVLGYDPEKDRLNPRAQIEVGLYLLKDYLGSVNWDSPDWQEQTLKGLARYGGYEGSDALERCRIEYASVIWTYANSFKDNTPIWPAPGNYTITSVFGMRFHPKLNVWRFHEGIDIAGNIGDPVVAAANGKIVYAGWASGYGNTIVLRTPTHDFLYGHLSQIYVSAGQVVTKGQEIGAIGNTGLSTGPHLHFGVSIGDWTNKNWIDPLSVLQKP